MNKSKARGQYYLFFYELRQYIAEIFISVALHIMPWSSEKLFIIDKLSDYASLSKRMLHIRAAAVKMGAWVD